MNIKDLFYNTLLGIIGILVLSELSGIFFNTAITFFLVSTKATELPKHLNLFMTINGLVILAVGFIIGYRSRKNKKIFYEIFFPKKGNLILALALSFIFLIVYVSILGLTFINVLTVERINFEVGIPLAFINYAILFFPFSAICYFIYRNRSKKEYKTYKFWIILLLILLNPFFVSISSSLGSLYTFSALNEPCGVIFSDFIPESPAQKVGMIPNIAITRMNDTIIKDTSNLQDFLHNTKPGDKIIVYTEDGKEYEIVLDKKPDDNYGFLGIKNVTTKFCKRNLFQASFILVGKKVL